MKEAILPPDLKLYTFQVIRSGDNAIDALFFIKQMFRTFQCNEDEQKRILNYLIAEIPKSITISKVQNRDFL